jgi:hypothetical protein
MTDKNAQGAASPNSVFMRQVIFCMAALGIMGAGAWSLMGQSAPYHPDMIEEDVTRSDASALTDVSD